MKQIKMTKVSLAVIGALAMLDVGMSQAFAAVEAEIQEMVVTAQKREQKLSEIPQAVQAFSGDAMEKAGIKDLNELISSIPGASEGRSTTSSSRSYQIRGVASYYGDSTVGYYLDDAVFSILNRNWAPVVRTFDVERVEVLRGPQGTLYGLGAMGGSIRFITAEPDLKEFRARGDAGYSVTKGGDPNWSGDLAVSIPLSKDTVAIRAVASYDHKGGWAESPTFPGEKNVSEAEYYRLKLLAKPTQELTVKLGYQHTDDRDDKGNQLLTVDPDRFSASTLGGKPMTTFNDSKMNVSNAYISYDFGPALLESSNGYIERSAAGRVPLIIGPLTASLNTGNQAKTFASELRLVSKGKDPFHWIGGAIYLHSKSGEDVNVNFASSPPFPPLLPYGTVYSAIINNTSVYESKSTAVFGEISYDFLDGRLTPLVGIRHFSDDRTFTDYERPHAPGVFPPFPTVPASTTSYGATFKSWNPRFNVSYKLTNEALVYTNVAKGFRSGTFNALAAVTAGAPRTVDPDKLWSYEVGTKLTLLNRKLSLEGAVYHLDWKNMQINETDPVTKISLLANAGKVKGDGFDYGINWVTPVKGLSLAASGNFNRTKFDGVNNTLFPNTNIVDGRQLSQVPKQTHTLSATYKTPLSGTELMASFYGAYTYIDKQGDINSIGATPATTVPAPLANAQNLLKMRIGVEGEHWGAHLVGENLTNQDDPTNISGSGFQKNYPRRIGLEFNFDY